MMTQKQQVVSMVAEFGGEIEFGKSTGQRFEIVIDSPDGQRWKSDGLHCLVHSQWDGQSTSELWADALNRVSEGLEECDDEECDVCQPE